LPSANSITSIELHYTRPFVFAHLPLLKNSNLVDFLKFASSFEQANVNGIVRTIPERSAIIILNKIA